MWGEKPEKDNYPVETPQVLLVTGLSGAGRGSSAKILEDLGWYVVDNIPGDLVPQLLTMHRNKNNNIAITPTKIAIVLDVRTANFNLDIDHLHMQLKSLGIDSQVLFLNASDPVLIRRFEHVKRPHPLQHDETLGHSIAQERSLLNPLRQKANFVIDTSELSTHDLRRELTRHFADNHSGELTMTIQSFGYKNGVPLDTDMLLDVRFIPNPHWIEHLRPFTGLEYAVSEYVLAQDHVEEFITGHLNLLNLVLDAYKSDGKSYFNLSIGCTGGKHRSVAVATELHRRLAQYDKWNLSIKHRDVGLE